MYKQLGKRVIDLIVSCIALIVLSPLMLFVALLIRVTDPGPIIFKQSRVGKDGLLFTFYKFRSMSINTGDISSDKVGEINIGLIGKAIRRTSIDELPQLFNILIGNMSIVGPRPPIPSQIELIKIRKRDGSIQCLPGLTGLAQISSFDGMSVNEKAAFDKDYANSISFMNDFIIIFRTFSYLFKKPPVY